MLGGNRLRSLSPYQAAPWYTHEAGTTFSDKLTTAVARLLARAIFSRASTKRDLQKGQWPLGDHIARAA